MNSHQKKIFQNLQDLQNVKIYYFKQYSQNKIKAERKISSNFKSKQIDNFVKTYRLKMQKSFQNFIDKNKILYGQQLISIKNNF